MFLLLLNMSTVTFSVSDTVPRISSMEAFAYKPELRSCGTDKNLPCYAGPAKVVPHSPLTQAPPWAGASDRKPLENKRPRPFNAKVQLSVIENRGDVSTLWPSL